jgi:serine/threonine protein kinase
MPQAPAGLLQPEPTSRLPVRPVLPEAPPLEAAARSYRDFLRQHDAADPRTLDSWCDSFPGHDEHARLFRDIHRANPQAASQLAEGLTAFPDVGTDFLGFHLVGELGRGAFGRVYLAQQGDLANRPVALKVSGEIDGESQMLARLQHTHIVPIYSYHRAGPLHAVCMPYLGSTTLADVLRDLGARGKLPESGKGLLSTLYDRKSRTTPTADGSKPSAVPGSAKDAAAAVTQSRQPADARPANVGDVTLRMLEGMSYVHAVLWVGACLADGLAHAHQRGILHRDLKPANVLLTDDGQPMLLDFNLSAYSKSEADASIALLGGTLPYMAPEHLAAFDGYELTPDARSDIYSLGIILYELLTGRHPFERRRGAVPAVLPAMVADRLQPPPALRHWNRAISPAVEAIVRHCLEPEPSKRYQTARQLHEDLERQCANLPLRHVREPSLRERAAKWYRRHPRFAPFGIATLAGLLLLVTATLLIVRGQELASRRAVAQRDRFRAEMREARLLLNSRIDDPGSARTLSAAGQPGVARERTVQAVGRPRPVGTAPRVW